MSRQKPHFFDKDTVEFVYSCGRDGVKWLAVIACAIAVHSAVKLLVVVGFSAWLTEFLSVVDECWVAVTVMGIPFTFLWKLYVKKK